MIGGREAIPAAVSRASPRPPALRLRAGRPDFALRFRRPPTSPQYIAGILAAVGVFGALPYAEEFLRCLRAEPSLAPTPAATDEPAGNLGVSAGSRAS